MAQYTQINPDALVTALTPINNSLGGKQDKTDNTLATTDKTISGAINEINTKVGNLTGALTWKGKFDTLPAVANYKAGNVVGVGNKEYVLTVTGSTKAWEELGDEGSYLLKSVAEETYLKKAAGEVATANIADGAVTKEKLANASVTYEKVSNDVQTKLDNNVKIVDQALTAAEQKQVRKNIAIPNYETFDDITKLSSLTAERLLYIGPDNVNVTVPVSVNTSTLEVDFQGRKINFSGYNSEQIAFKGHSECKLKNLIFKLVDVSYKKDANICISKFGYVENIELYCTVGDQTVGFKENHTLGFLSCDHLYNCKVYGGGVLGEPGIAIGYKYCNYLNMCRYSGSGELPGLIGFSHCNFISQCYSTHSNRDYEEAYGIGTNSNVDSLIWIGGDGGEFTTYSDIDHAIIGGYDTTNMFNTISSNGGTGKTKLYAKPDDKSGMATVLLDTTPVNWAVARRTPKGTLKAKDATEDDDLVTKKQLDAAEKTYAKKTDIPTIPAIPTVNDPKVSIKMNGAEKGSFTLNQASAGEVDLGTVITAHQDISGKVDKTLNAKSFEAITIQTTNSAADKAANVAAIKAYVNNLKTLGVDTTKILSIPVRMGIDTTGNLMYRDIGNYFSLSGMVFGFNDLKIAYVYIGNDGHYSEFLKVYDDEQLKTSRRDIVSAINEVNTLAKSKGNGTITEVKMNGASKGTSGVVDLGTVLTEHQPLKTINGETITGSGNINITGGVTKCRINANTLVAGPTGNEPMIFKMPLSDVQKYKNYDVVEIYSAENGVETTMYTVYHGAFSEFYATSNGTGWLTGIFIGDETTTDENKIGFELIISDTADTVDKDAKEPISSRAVYTALQDKQDKTDNTLSTTDKTIAGSINEINTAVKNIATIAEIDNLFVINTGSI